MGRSHFQFKNVGKCLLVTLRGRCSMAMDIQYLAALSEELKKRNGRAFYLLCDVRTWDIPNKELNEKIISPLQFDRRNQLGEFWLEDTNTNADHIAAKFSQNINFPFHRTQDEGEFLGVAKSIFDEETADEIDGWLYKNTLALKGQNHVTFG